MPGEEKTVKTLFLEYFLFNYCCHGHLYDVTLLEKFENMTIYDEEDETILFRYHYLHVAILELLKYLNSFVEEDKLQIIQYFEHSLFAIGGARLWFKSVSHGVDLKTILLNSKRF